MAFLYKQITTLLLLNRRMGLKLLGYGLLFWGFSTHVQADTGTTSWAPEVHLKDYGQLCRKIIECFEEEADKLQNYTTDDPDYKRASKEKKKKLRIAKYKTNRQHNLKKFVQEILASVAYIQKYVTWIKRGLGLLAFAVVSFFLVRHRDTIKSPISMWQQFSHDINEILYGIYSLLSTLFISKEGKSAQELNLFGDVIIKRMAPMILSFASIYVVRVMFWVFHELYYDYETYQRYNNFLSIDLIQNPMEKAELLYMEYLPQLTDWAQKQISDIIRDGYKEMMLESAIYSHLKEIEKIINATVPADKCHPMRALTEENMTKLQKRFTFVRKGKKLFEFWRQILLRIQAKQRYAEKKGLLSHEVSGKREIILLYGAPGTGKTCLTKSILTAYNVPYINGDLSGDIRKYISMLNSKSPAPVVMVLDDGDRYLMNKKISAQDLAFFDPARRYVNYRYKGESFEVRLPDVVIVIVNYEIDDHAVQDRFTLTCKAEGYTPEGKLKIAYDHLTKVISDLQESGYDIREEDFKAADHKKIKACINPESASVRPEINEVTNIVYEKIAAKIGVHTRNYLNKDPYETGFLGWLLLVVLLL